MSDSPPAPTGAFGQALVIINSLAGLKLPGSVGVRVKKRLIELGYQPLVLELDRDFEKNLARQKLTQIKLVVAVGGDGTVRVAVRTMFEQKLKAPLAIVPFGSANVVATSLGMSLSLKKSLARLASAQTQAIDVGMIDGSQPFLVGFSIGYISSLVAHTPRWLKNVSGVLAYCINLLIHAYRLPSIEFTIYRGERAQVVTGNSLIIFNVINLYGLKPRKAITMTDGRLDLYVVKGRNLLALLKIGLDFLRFERPPKHLVSFEDTNFVIDVAPGSDSFQIDGDKIVIDGRPITVSVKPQAVRIIV